MMSDVTPGPVKQFMALMHDKLVRDEALMRQALDAITNVLAGGDFDSPYADLKQAAAALKERLK